MRERSLSKGYEVKLFFLNLPSPEIAIARVCQRVREGGHNVQNAEPALQRAAERAKERARRHGHGIMFYENGRVIEKPVGNDKEGK
jgi:predicted ABC-type ATPase